MKYLSTILIIFVFLIPFASIAGNSGGGRSYEDGLFWGADLNRNERLDRDEAKAVYNLGEDEIFARFDEDANGLINRAEFSEYIQVSPWTDRFVHPKDK
ncbi:MAG: EF-hand domain-containing protein [Pseudomonadota bacterium]